MHKKTIIITGASSGLGKELAIQYAKLGYRLFLSARSEELLNQVVKTCNIYTEEAYVKVIDVCDKKGMYDWVQSIKVKYPIDLVIANAGVSAGTLGGIETQQQIYQIFDTNLYGVLNTIIPVIEAMISQKNGQIAIVSSNAGLLPLSGAPSYSVTKNAVRMYGDCIRPSLKQYNIKVAIIIPGFITTPMTDVNNFPMPFKVSVEKAAKIIIDALKAEKEYIYFPKILYYLTKILSFLPYPILDYLLSKLPAKGSSKN